MADNDKPAEEQPETKPTRSRKKLIILGAMGLVTLAAIGAAVAFFLMGSPKPPGVTDSSEAAVEATKESNSNVGDQTANNKASEDKAQSVGGDNVDTDPDSEKDKAKEEVYFGDTITLKPFHLNLGNPLENRYVRLEVALEYKGGDKQKQELELRIAQLRDVIITVTTRKTREFLLGPDGKDQLRMELLNGINQYLNRKIESVFLTDIIIE